MHKDAQIQVFIRHLIRLFTTGIDPLKFSLYKTATAAYSIYLIRAQNQTSLKPGLESEGTIFSPVETFVRIWLSFSPTRQTVKLSN